MRLTWRKAGHDGIDSLSLTEASVLTIGRQSGSEITLSDSNVSRTHARLIIGSDSVRVEDLGSTNGTKLDGQKLSLPSGDLGKFLP
ncbi:MAG: FHA domain-containing protein [Rhodomicrobium sp.]|nr:FHA domain-containing protein [Rhodomicrobium sp.]